MEKIKQELEFLKENGQLRSIPQIVFKTDGVVNINGKNYIIQTLSQDSQE